MRPQQRRDARIRALLARARTQCGEERSRIEQAVVLEYIEVARAIANRYAGSVPDRRDLDQVAYLGLVKAVHRFDPSRHEELVAFAVPTIAGEIKRYLRDSTWMVRPPRSLQELSLRLGIELHEMEQRIGREPTPRELSRETGLPLPLVEESLRCMRSRHALSLDAPLDSGESRDDRTGASLAESLGRDDPGFDRTELSILLSDALSALGKTERRIVHLRFTCELTQNEIARELGVSQMQVSRLIARVLAALRSRLSSEIPAH